MSGRMKGRGRERPNSFIEQLGFHKGDLLPTTTMQPLPTYLPLNNKPMPIELTTEMSYLVELKRDFAEYMQESSNNIQVVVVKEDIKRFCEDYDMSMECNKLEYDWSRIPAELKSLEMCKSRKRKQKKDVDVTRKLMKLEKKESKANEEEEGEDKEEDEEEDAEEKEMNERMKEEDQEMDAGTDYNFEYFENDEKDFSDDDIDKNGATY